MFKKLWLLSFICISTHANVFGMRINAKQIAGVVAAGTISYFLIQRGITWWQEQKRQESIRNLELLIDTISQNDAERFTDLIADQNLINAQDSYGWTPLHHVVFRQQTHLAQLLIENDACMNIPNKVGITPLHFGAFFGNENIVTMLLKKGARIDRLSSHKKTPFHRASETNRDEIIRLLITDSFFKPLWNPAALENLSLKERALIKVLGTLRNNKFLKNNLIILEDWSAALIADQLPLEKQQILANIWLQKNDPISLEQLRSLIFAHMKRHLKKIQAVITQKDFSHKTAYSIAQGLGNHTIASLLDHVSDAQELHDLRFDLQQKIKATIEDKLTITH